MKKLTGRAAEDFKGWLFSTRNEVIKVGVMEYDLYYMFMYMLPETCQNALIIEWLDSVGIYIHPKRNCTGIKFNHWYFIITNRDGVHLSNFLEIKIEKDCRTEAINAGITKANELYNLNN